MFRRIFTNIFSTISGKDVINKMDEWKLTSEETVKYQLEWLKSLPTGFQIAQRFIGVGFSIAFLIMVLTAYFMDCFGLDITSQKEFIAETMVDPIKIIFSLYFGGGLINSFKGMINKDKKKD